MHTNTRGTILFPLVFCCVIRKVIPFYVMPDLIGQYLNVHSTVGEIYVLRQLQQAMRGATPRRALLALAVATCRMLLHGLLICVQILP